MNKCTHKPGGYADSLCETMKGVYQLYPSTRKSKGLFRAEITNIKTQAPLGSRITIHSGEYLNGGIVANYCPFCGGKLRDSSAD